MADKHRSSLPMFLDTSAMIALLNPRDQYHTRMANYLATQTLPIKAVTSNLILSELLTFFSRHGDLSQAIAFENKLRADPNFKVIWIDIRLHEAALSLLHKFKDQHLSYTDATSFAIMRQESLRTAIAFDQDFISAGFETVP